MNYLQWIKHPSVASGRVELIYVGLEVPLIDSYYWAINAHI